MEGGSLFERDDASDDASSSSSSSTILSHPSPPHGGILIRDKHITYASLHTPLVQFLRKDVIPFVLMLSAIVLQAAPALWYEIQVAYLRSGESEEDATSASSLGADENTIEDATKLFNEETDVIAATGAADATSANITDTIFGALINSTSVATTNSTTKPLTEIDIAVSQLDMPSNLSFYFMYALPVYLFFSAIMWLVLYWNVKLQILLRYRNFSKVEAALMNGEATHVRVVPVEHGGKSEICEIKRVKQSAAAGASSASQGEVYFIFQKTKYLLHHPLVASAASIPAGHVTTWFAPLDFPIHEPLQYYIDAANSEAPSSGATTSSAVTPASVESRFLKYGLNEFDIPLPPFADLFKEHALAPFFLFQIFCVLLWCLDEYWYYSLVTLFMLVMFECTVVKRRLKNLEFLREMRMKPYMINVYRQKKWQEILTSNLLPYDIVSLVRPQNEQYVVPADILLLTGNVVLNESMLTGESVPQQKENIEQSNESMKALLEIQKGNKRNMLFGGTKILLANPPSSSSSASSSDASSSSSVVLKSPPDGGCIGMVLRTGFNTSQGKLVRTILFSSESVSINNIESLLFIGVLLIFAVIASAYVVMKGLEDPNRSRYKLLLNSIMIITSVVPPELPMELSLAVNTSLLALMKQHIFCTEPFRIPLAGAVDICCFDKTGTLTADEFVVKGIAGVQRQDGEGATAASLASSSTTTSSSAPSIDSDPNLINSASELPLATKYVIAGCHSLAFLPDQNSSSSSSSPMDSLIGDPLEKSAITFIEWSVGRTESAVSAKGRERIRFLHKYPFSSALKRMSAIIALDHEPGSKLRAVTKGAAETMEAMFDVASMPKDYARLHASYSQQGCRVLALGWKELELHDLPDDRKTLKSVTRESLESGLQFAGFLVLQCPLKKDSRDVIQQLKASSHQVMMITGDHVLTSCFVAGEVGITTKPTLILQATSTANASASSSSSTTSATATAGLEWQRNTLEKSVGLPFVWEYTESSLKKLTKEYDLCVSGDALEYLTHTISERCGTDKAATTKSIALFVSYIRVFARTSPDQKELILHWLKSRGLTTLMCGDGTNDVGALKQAHIGVALIGEDAIKAATQAKNKKAVVASGPPKPIPPPAPGSAHATRLAKIKAAQAALGGTSPTINSGVTGAMKSKMQQQLAAQLAQLEAEMSVDENTTPRLGDASIASPFTSKLPFITSCVDIIRQGRCTLVTTMQMFNILGVNCLISAYSMSVLYASGIKWGDRQMTIASLSIAGFFFCISRSQPLKQLSAERPAKKLFSFSMILSVLGQFAIHMYVLLSAISAAEPHTPTTEEHRAPEKTFKPNVLNSVVYLVSTTQTVATFAANYRGRPFMEGLTENKALFKMLGITLGLMLLLTSEILPELNTALELHKLPSAEFRSDLMNLLLLDVAVTYMYTKLLRKLFAVKPSEEQQEAARSAIEKKKQK